MGSMLVFLEWSVEKQACKLILVLREMAPWSENFPTGEVNI